MYEAFEAKTFTPAVLDVISQADAICRDYARQGYSITLRQLYYQFVARDLIPNKQTSYDRLGRIVSDGRLSGLIDWAHLEDRTREVYGDWSGHEPTPAEAIEAAAQGYGFDLWQGQPRRIEVWVEKQALIEVVQRAASRFRVASFACKGYVSQSEMYEAGKRIQGYLDVGQTPLILHLGDHDPSGLDMTRDIERRLSMFGYTEVEVRRIALNMDQVEAYNPPPNPAKMTDSRVHDYISQYGPSSWELDALDPATLDALIALNIRAEMDEPAFEAERRRERQVRAQMVNVAQHWDEISEQYGA